MKSATMEPALYQVLEKLVPKLDDLHEIIRGLDHQYINSWGSFILIHEDNIPTMTEFTDGVTELP